MVRRVVRYELITIDTGWRRVRRRFRLVLAGMFEFFLHGSAIARHPLSQYQATLAQPFAEKVVAGSEGFAVASAVDNAVVASFLNQQMAEDHLAAQLTAEPSLAGALHVVPAYEAVGV